MASKQPNVGEEFYKNVIEFLYKIGFSKGKMGFFNSREHGDAGGIIFIDFGASYKKSIFIKFLFFYKSSFWTCFFIKKIVFPT